MKKYNFDEIYDRNNTNCEKYDSRDRIFGTSDLIPMWVADTDFKTPDFIVNALKTRLEHEIFGYSFRSESYYHAIVNWQMRRHGWKIDRDSIYFSPNVVIGLSSIVQAYTNVGDKIIVQPPVYFPFYHVIEGNNREIILNQLKVVDNRYYFDLDDLVSKIDEKTKMIFLCNPHNPGGMVWKPEELKALGDICLKNNILVVSDEIHSDLILGENKHTPFASISEEFAMQSITCMSASKTFNIAGLSSSYLIIQNKKLAENYIRYMHATHLDSGNLFGVIATEAAYTYGDEWLSQLLAYIEINVKTVEHFFSDKFPMVKPFQTEGTYLIWLDFSALSISSSELSNLFVDAGVGLNPGMLFGKGGDQFMRMNVGCPHSVVVSALSCIERALMKLNIREIEG